MRVSVALSGLVVGAVVGTASGAAQALDPLPPCGHISIRAHALARSSGGQPPAEQKLEQTYAVLTGHRDKYANAQNDTIVAREFPAAAGGAFSRASLSTFCEITGQAPDRPRYRMSVVATSDLNSGSGVGAGAAGDMSVEWTMRVPLSPPSSAERWTLNVASLINAANVMPRCSLRIDEQPARVLENGSSTQAFAGLSGAVTVRARCEQDSLTMSPNGAAPRAEKRTVFGDFTLSVARQ